ncbi:helix-turn-helix domain-containing protein [Stenotrophomonas rhizophila]|nr:helix-turn-helix domain-containing protein [Stenotrophomonas rhizophila]
MSGFIRPLQFNPGTKIIEVQICYLRKVLKSLQAPFEIRTLRGRGLTIRAVEGDLDRLRMNVS